MKSVTYSEKAKEEKEGHALLQKATARLEEVLGPSAGLVSAAWDRTQDERGRVLYTLRLSDFTGEVFAAFTPDELRSSAHLRSRLLDLWGDLLQVRSNTQVKKLQQLVTG